MSDRAICGWIAMAVAASWVCVSAGAAEVSIDLGKRHQTILGWSANPSARWVTDWQRDRFLDEAVHELGLNRMRWGQPNGSRADIPSWEPVNDDADPYHINWKAFATDQVDTDVRRWMLPFKKRVEANGEPFGLWISPSFFNGGSTGMVPAWLRHSPAEYGEYALAALLYLKNKHGIVAELYSICNEAGNGNHFSPEVVAAAVRDLAPRMKAAGLPTKIQFPECVNARASLRYIQAVEHDEDFWRHVGLLTYHLYGTQDADRNRIGEIGRARGIPTGQTEYMSLSTDHLYKDLVEVGVAHWSIYGLGSCLKLRHDGASFTRERWYWPFRQVMHYVRPGAVRVEAACDDASLRAMAFVKAGRATVILLNDVKSSRPATVAVKGLPAGLYGLSRSVNGRTYEELGVRTIEAGGPLDVHVPKGAVLTVYPHPGGNLPPTVTACDAEPSFLTSPHSQARLVGSAADPEKDALAFAWSVVSAPAGARSVLAEPSAATTKVTGLAAPGAYTFALDVKDAAHTVRREVRLHVFTGNQPPLILDLHNRIPIDVTLPESSTLLRAWPVNLQGAKTQGRWSIFRQPVGAEVKLEPTSKDDFGRKVTGLTVAGEYTFRFHATDGTVEVHKDHTIVVHPVNRPPVIASAVAEPARVDPAAGSAELIARASDGDGDTVTCYWSLKRAPAGARPVIDKPGLPRTKVTGLTTPGEYVFNVAAIDRAQVANAQVRLTVGAAAGH